MNARFHGRFRAALALVLCLLIASCRSALPYRQVSIRQASSPALVRVAGTEPAPVRVAVAAILSPQSTANDYERFIVYLSSRLGRPAQLVQRATYAETNDLLRTHRVDLAFVCTGAYVQGQQEFGMELLAMPQMNGKHTYHSYLIVPDRRAVQTLEDLRGGVFAFTDPLSLSGYLVPRHLLASQGRGSPDAYFGRILYTYSHENSIRAVSEGWVDGAAVDSLVYDATVAQNPDYGRAIRIIWRSEPYGAPPVVVHPDLDAALKEQLRNLVLHMDQDEEGQRALISLGVERFVPPEDRLYDSARAVLATMKVAK